ncbi:MAG: DUF378 domain-containing protein [Bacilli bacterium]
MVTIQKIALVFTIVGAINWGLVGFFDYNLVESLFKNADMIPKVIYSIVGICGLINIGILFMHFKDIEK